MVGGEHSVLEGARPVLETFGDPILHLGTVGAGQTAKLVNNLAFTSQIALALDTFAFVDTLGLDPSAMAQVLARGSGGSFATAVVSGNSFDVSGLAVVAGPLLRKDFRLIADVARNKDVELPSSLLDLAERSLAMLRPPDADT
jgi:3-hydroxyisobutyrate dehydrogenase-like beta-hydroxyacid dehydrogenase